MATGKLLIIVSQQPFDRFWWNLLRWRRLAVCRPQKCWTFRSMKMKDGGSRRVRKFEKSRYLSNVLTDLHKIRLNDGWRKTGLWIRHATKNLKFLTFKMATARHFEIRQAAQDPCHTCDFVARFCRSIISQRATMQLHDATLSRKHTKPTWLITIFFVVV